VFRYRDADNHYRLDMDNESCNQTQLIRKVDGVETVLASAASPHPQGPAFQLEVDLRGDAITISLNGRVLFGGTQYDGELETGTIGLYTWASQPAEFDDIQVFAACP
jgi:hypothetical protein